ncbi:asparagine synthase (glutamine-hydrolyzing) [Ramlibacter tataouinensis]|uniref:asparagine synthase (glutamine-hydrolyzing) n=1 Tax=Ramlibacter tataouinensis TaxID=94132 RepID=UPI0022F3F35B|nr:asparagine synthase (glutamine-hydrolyzing) [Ramlibacter tataouinensis]WBY00723.1 asparagine synthase (glutamine-hydrolyzing) [Ramlibacter tataouinensis]
MCSNCCLANESSLITMCGIFGALGAGNRSVQSVTKDVHCGLDAIRHRGPDGRSIWVSDDGLVGLGHARLAVIDLATGDQPMHSACGRWSIVYNGEVYNYLELRQELGGEGFRTTSDTEVILRAYMRWGPGCVTRLRGMFAFAIWDSKERKLFLARDRFGIKPLYWARTRAGFFFASEMKALRPFLDEGRVNKAALSDYFSFQFCLGDKTLLDGVSQLPAAHHALVAPGEAPRPQRYWEVQYDIDFDHSEKWFTERLRALLDDSIRMHLRADVEVGSYVSGGIDSSLVAALAREQHPEGRFQGFNGRFTDGPEFDESHYARALADERDLQLHVADIGEQDFVDNIRQVIWHLDQPTAGPGSFPQYMVSKKVREHVKVVLGGQGGDEIFGGYARYLVAYFEQCIKGAIEGTLHNGNYVVTYESIIPNLESLRQYKPMIREFWAEGLFEERDRRYWRLVNRANTFGDALAPGSIDRDATFAEFQQIFWGQNVGKESYFDAMTHFDFKTLLPALLQVEDRMAMAHGVESRVPFLDHPLVEFAATIPADVKFQNGELKRLLKHVFAAKLPASIKERKDKMGFPVPLTLWLRRKGPAAEFVRDVFSSRAARERSYLARPVDLDHILSGQSVYSRNLWALLSLELWQQAFLDDPVA